MSCPLLRRSQSQCNAVAGGPFPLVREVIATFCRDSHARCPAFRFFRATGRFAHPADFRAWVLRGIAPGRCDPVPEATSHTDPA
jgi:hypothetical protein